MNGARYKNGDTYYHPMLKFLFILFIGKEVYYEEENSSFFSFIN